jgi:acetyl esterase/lipase
MLDAQARAFLARNGDGGEAPPASVSEARAVAEREVRFGGDVEDAAIADHGVPCDWGSLHVRIYRPRHARPVASLMWLHGGGWVAGSVDTADRVCRRLAARANLAVASVAYRLAPEHPYPSALEDAIAAFSWLRDAGPSLGLDVDRLGVGGDSAGGNLAAGLALERRDERGAMPAFLLLAYPILELDAATPSRRRYATGFGYPLAELEWSWRHYLGPAAAEADRYAVPARAASLAGLPPTLVYAAECDILFSEGEQFARRQRAAGVPGQLVVCTGQIHGFANLAGEIDAGRRFAEDVGRRLPELLASDLSDTGRLGVPVGSGVA